MLECGDHDGRYPFGRDAIDHRRLGRLRAHGIIGDGRDLLGFGVGQLRIDRRRFLVQYQYQRQQPPQQGQ